MESFRKRRAGDLKLIDFGIARAIESDATENIHRDTQVGTLNFMAPEALEGVRKHGASKCGGPPDVRLGRSSDVWSLGYVQRMHASCVRF